MIVSGVEKRESIIVVNAKENNLKSINVDIPLNTPVRKRSVSLPSP